MLLTIAIPTYNRLSCLQLLLESIFNQVSNLKKVSEKLEILVSNNNSTDNTQEYLESYKTLNSIRCIHNKNNIGASANVVQCFKEAKGRYVWIIGDDDLPMIGSIMAVLKVLEAKKPDALYIPAKWINGSESLDEFKDQLVENTSVSKKDKFKLIADVNSHITFISSWVVNKPKYLDESTNPDPARHIDTYIPHLEWILYLCLYGDNLIVADNNWLFARGGCSGGYDLIKTFSNDYFEIIDSQTKDEKVKKILKQSMLYTTIPSFIWGIKKGSLGNFTKVDNNNILEILKPYYKKEIYFSIMISMILKPNILIAFPLRAFGKLIGHLVMLKIKRLI